MGEHVIKMPDLGEGIAEVEVVAWRVQPGERVVEDQVLADVMTDKATVEIPSPVHGTVLSLGGAVGAALAVGAELIRLQVEGSGNAVAGNHPDLAPAPKPPTATAEAAPVPANAKAPAATQALRAVGEKPLAAPAVRQRAWDLGVELQYVAGSGPAGRITHADLDVYVARAGKPAGGAAAERYGELHGEQAVPIIGLRRKIAEKMQDAKRRIPHFTYVEEIDVTEIEALRTQLNTRWGGERGRLTLLPLLMRAIVLAVRSFPQVNARFDDEAGVVTRFEPVHIGIATQTEPGLMVPVVRHAEARDPWSGAAEVARLADAARAGRALREELSGSTITITSLGALGGIVTTPVINHPEVAIVGVNRIVERPVIRNGAIVARKMMNLSCSFDHRIIDGVYAAQFVQAIRGYLECPATLFVE
ncbi:dihydrolipoamide acetyltransferase family protein [Massilia psychrophila]|uniref:Dihydrolipoamide acetyltransferase component of pyruvate dehydrogenase complex n=1 Tax=Massilia psychrophila TaxID=1603353 RepID=A0A2G8T2A4_9BURK|nr:dihydrolipoamide acetyltransferase family protein [Massilia psychrophila]PIL40187.1 branched-chain alpha-keto acid dehydrogenase subunit E2 [Massilia psychrophila]GGE75656.1 lipoamide acyltransferase component of branched-chain alpha-keto acid dehydrogenase complex [Massilia psychrophila]